MELDKATFIAAVESVKDKIIEYLNSVRWRGSLGSMKGGKALETGNGMIEIVFRGMPDGHSVEVLKVCFVIEADNLKEINILFKKVEGFKVDCHSNKVLGILKEVWGEVPITQEYPRKFESD